MEGAFWRASTKLLCAALLSTSPSSSSVLSSVNGQWTTEFVSFGSIIMLGSVTRIFQFWVRGQLNESAFSLHKLRLSIIITDQNQTFCNDSLIIGSLVGPCRF